MYNLHERKLTGQELKKREKYAKDLPDAEFKKRYGANWKSVKIATATKLAKEDVNIQEMTFAVKIEGLPTMYLDGSSAGIIKSNLRKMFKSPDAIQSVERITQADVRKVFRDKLSGKEIEEAIGPKDASDAGEYDYEGEMAINDLETILDAAEDIIEMLDDETNLPEWCQAKITKAADYLDTVRDYLEAENEADEDDDEVKENVITNLLTLRRQAKDILEATFSDRSKIKDFAREKNPVETIIKTLQKDRQVIAHLNKRPRFDRALYMDGEELILGDSVVLRVKDSTTIADIKKAILKVK